MNTEASPRLAAIRCEAIARAVLGEALKRESQELIYKCPHPERHTNGDAHPSLKVNQKKDTWGCFVCGVGGTAWQLGAFLAGLDPSDKSGVTAWLRERGLLNGASRNGHRPSASEQRRIAEFYYSANLRKVRIEPGPDGRPKIFVWEHLDGEIWKSGDGGTKDKPLYVNARFRELRERGQLESVLGFEGEAKVDLAGELGFAAFSFKGLMAAQCSVLAGFDVVLWPDKDPSGSQQCDGAAKIMRESQHPRLIRTITPPAGLPTSGDVVDAVRTLGWGRAEIDKLLRNASEWKPVAQSASGFTLTPLGDLLARPDLPVDYVLEDRLVAGTVSVIVAKPKVGKSTFARNLSLAISRGEDFLGLKTKHGECIYLALEEREEEVRADFRAMGADGSEPILIHAAIAPAEGLLALCDLIRQRRPVLVVVDPLFRLARIRDEKAYAETYAALGPLIDVARIAGTHVLLTHHAGKSLKADAIDSPLGSTAIGGAVASVLVMRRTEAYRTLQSVQRIGLDLQEIVLQFDAEGRRLSVGGTRLEADRQQCESDILEFLKGAAEPQTQAQIRDGVEGQTRIIRAALTALVGTSRVKKSGNGMKGNPFRYECWFAGSQDMSGTREPASQNGPDTRINTADKVVPENSHQPILVPDEESTRFTMCWHCRGTGRCGCTACWKGFAGAITPCAACHGTGKIAEPAQQ